MKKTGLSSRMAGAALSFCTASCCAIGGAAAQVQAVQVQAVGPGQTTQVNGVNVACTGAGLNARDQAQWINYPVKLEFVGGYGQFLGDETVTVTPAKGAGGMTFSCASPWLFMDLKPGSYQVKIDMPGGATKSVSVTAARGQKDIIVRFPGMMAGAPQGTPAARQ